MRALVVASLAACSGGSHAADAVVPCPIGDMSGPAQLEIWNQDAAFNATKTVADSHVPLVPPPQGGWILLLGARATNIDGCRLTITTSFREPCNTAVLGLEIRPTRLDPDADGWGTMRVNAFGNLPVCPIVAWPHDLHDNRYEVTVRLEDVDGRSATQSLLVDPICPDPDPTGRCLCECRHDYAQGPCPTSTPDAGVTMCDGGI